MMRVFTTTALDCDGDGCGECYADTVFVDAEQTEKLAQRDGWRINEDGTCFCPECVKRQATEMKTVKIPACEMHEGHNFVLATVPWVCPVCKGPRGKVTQTISWDGSRRLYCDGWKNPCGHIDTYKVVREEAKRIKEGVVS